MKLVANKGGDTRALLTTRDGTSYDLTGPLVATLVASDGANMEIQGTVIAQSGSRRWQLEVTDWRVVPQRDYERLTGTLTVKGSDAWLVTDDGERYELPGLPKGLDDGERIQVIADGPLVVGRDMAWSVIHSPPPSQTKAQSDESSELDPSSLAGEQLIVESAELATMCRSHRRQSRSSSLYGYLRVVIPTVPSTSSPTSRPSLRSACRMPR